MVLEKRLILEMRCTPGPRMLLASVTLAKAQAKVNCSELCSFSTGPGFPNGISHIVLYHSGPLCLKE